MHMLPSDADELKGLRGKSNLDYLLVGLLLLLSCSPVALKINKIKELMGLRVINPNAHF